MRLIQRGRAFPASLMTGIAALAKSFFAGSVQNFLVIALIFFLSVNTSFSFERYNKVSKFDHYFSKYTKRFFGPGMDWRVFKAQAVAESRLSATAKSRVGAKGIMQIMPKTFEEILQKNPAIRGTREQPRWNIAAGIWYDRSLWDIWKAKRARQDRIDFMMGSYNAGKGHIIKAQKKAKQKGFDPNSWQSIEKTLPGVTGRHSRETTAYVRKIKLIKGVLK